ETGRQPRSLHLSGKQRALLFPGLDIEAQVAGDPGVTDDRHGVFQVPEAELPQADALSFDEHGLALELIGGAPRSDAARSTRSRRGPRSPTEHPRTATTAMPYAPATHLSQCHRCAAPAEAREPV